jgi:inner membrane protein
MDPLTHTLVGVSLAATHLSERTRLATPALVIGANLPDIDVFSYFRGGDFALGFRRGWTHGVLALVVLPAILAGLLMLWDRWRGRSGRDSPSLSPRWLFALSYLACWTHPCLDWLNNYGMRWLMPFRDTWFYGDSVFIMDPWLWLILGLGWVIGRRPSTRSSVAAAVMAGLVVWLVGSRALDYLPVVGSVFAVLLLAYFWRPRAQWLSAHRIATVGLVLGTLYIGALISLHSLTVSRTQAKLQLQGFTTYQELMAGPAPADPLAWDILVESGGVYRWGRFDWRHDSLVMSQSELPSARPSPYWDDIVASGQSPGFLRWVRFPWLDMETTANGRRIYLMDARYTRARADGFGATSIIMEP